MIWENIVAFVDRLKGSKDVKAKDIIPPWHHDITPEHQKHKISELTEKQKETIEQLRMEMKMIVEQRRMNR